MTRRRRSGRVRRPGPSVRRTMAQRSRLARVNRTAVKASAGMTSSAILVTLKLTPQIRQTSIMPPSCAVRCGRGDADGDGGEDGEALTAESGTTEDNPAGATREFRLSI